MEIKTWYIVSDIHSFATELKNALYDAGFDKKDPTKGLIVCGDVFDRGEETIETYKFLSSIPKKRCILIRGNHEQLFFDLLNKSYPDSYDFSNGTVNTMCQIACRDINDLHNGDVSWKEITDFVRSSTIYSWLKSKQWINYYELGKYIFVHSFIPLNVKDKYAPYIALYGTYGISGKAFDYRPDWRNASNFEWSEASWGDPIDYYQNGLFEEEAKKGKVLVCGHWHVSDFWWRISNIKSYDSPITDIYYSKDLIGLDCGVFRDPISRNLVHPQNVLIIKTDEPDICYGTYRQPLKFARYIPRIETVTEETLEK